MSRPDWDTYFLGLAKAAAARATCRVQVGCVAVVDRDVVATGFNGAPSGMPHCTDVGCEFYGHVSAEYLRENATSVLVVPRAFVINHCQRAIHAEMNAIGRTAANGRAALKGATWYLWPFGPCHSCQLQLITTKPSRIVFPRSSATSGTYAELMAKTGIQVDIVSPDILEVVR